MYARPLGLAAIAMAVALPACDPGNAQDSAGARVADNAASSDAVAITVHRSPTCGCCELWIEHLRENGFAVTVVDETNLVPLKERLGVPGRLHSCHTAEVNGYVVEGHVPADVIHRMLEEKPTDIAGIGVPGMPRGSPGMEVPGMPAESYAIVAFDRNGAMKVYEQR
jgi:hypothetical protein